MFEFQKRINDWQKVVGDSREINQAINSKYAAIEPITKYLDIEDEQKQDFQIEAPSSYVHKDVSDFKVQFKKIEESFLQQERNLKDKKLLNILDKASEL